MAITRKDLKTRAKAVLSTQYWWFLAALLIYEVLPMLVTPSTNLAFLMQNLSYSVAYSIIMGIVLFILLISIFLISPLYMAICRFLLKRSTEPEAQFTVIWEILRDNYFRLVKAGFMRDIFLLLWSLPYIAVLSVSIVFIQLTETSMLFLSVITVCLIGAMLLFLYKTYSYSMVNFIMADRPETGWREALAESKQLMHGRTFFAFKLELSFIGWQLLGLLAFGIGIYFVQPYIAATEVQFYLSLTNKNQYIMEE